MSITAQDTKQLAFSVSRLLLWHLFALAESHFRLGRAAKAGRSTKWLCVSVSLVKLRGRAPGAIQWRQFWLRSRSLRLL